MPYHKNKQQAFQAAQQEASETKSHFETLDSTSKDYGSELKHLKEEVNETNAQIQNALEVASEHQRSQLETFQKDINQIVQEINEVDEI
ncbi:hypothetical protein J9317_10080 [Metabacillus sp. KIGAM252]|uniref:Small, acid-soluble spore protein N n=1 Tax=Metabacillus flavus TaxID=2823519 RepID=A0ABS5LFE2_9BACI|nr:hypothetical protein [Metabacillus flavus]MBS2969109.1 hypothetical protein [Metabacillus flavus]